MSLTEEEARLSVEREKKKEVQSYREGKKEGT